MCWSKKCCFFEKLNLGCLMIGVFNLILSLGISLSSIVLLSVENDHLQYMHSAAEHFLGAFHLDVNPRSKELILSIVLFVALLLAVSSMSLIIGVMKRVSGYVLGYFGFGIFVTVLTSISSLLLLLTSTWGIAAILMAASLIKVHCLVVVHTFYEDLQRGEAFEQTLDLSEFDDDNPLIEIGTFEE